MQRREFNKTAMAAAAAMAMQPGKRESAAADRPINAAAMARDKQKAATYGQATATLEHFAAFTLQDHRHRAGATQRPEQSQNLGSLRKHANQ